MAKGVMDLLEPVDVQKREVKIRAFVRGYSWTKELMCSWNRPAVRQISQGDRCWRAA